jgi:hypothetical protein
MPGLLDLFGNDPQQQGLLAMAAQMMQASGPSTTPHSFGQVAGSGLLAGMQASQQAQQQQQARMLRDLQMQGLQGELTDKEKARKDALDAQEWMRNYQKSQMGGDATAPARAVLGNDLRPTVENAAKLEAAWGGPTPPAQPAQATDPYSQRMAMAQQMRNSGIPALMNQAAALEEHALKFKPEFSQTPQVGTGPDGKPFTYVLDKDGNPKLLNGVLPRDKMELANLGGKDVAYNPFALQPGQTFQRTVSPDSVYSGGITMRGQNMTDARARELNAITANNKAPTEFQGKSAAFGLRATEADKILSGLQGKYSPAAVNTKNALGSVWGIGGALGTGANAFLSDTDQRAEQAQRDFVNAVLRQESGASIGAAEFDNAIKQYFPQPNDGAAVIAQKARNRQLAIQGLQANAGHAAMTAPSASQPAVGFKFLGFE